MVQTLHLHTEKQVSRSPATLVVSNSVTSSRLIGVAAVLLAGLFNIPYAVLVATFDYPDVLRRPAGQVLDLFAAGGNALILTWHAFAVTALSLMPVAIGLSISPARMQTRPALAIGAAIAGSLAAITQAIGLWRWVFVIPSLARSHADPATSQNELQASERAFDLLNAYGGVAIGEHLGQLLTAAFVLLLATLQHIESQRITATAGFISGAMIAVGTGEGLAIALGRSGQIYSFATVAGYLGLTVWLIATGINLIRAKP